MKKIATLFLLLIFFSATYSQGLENIIVEKYYVSNAADSAASVGLLPVGSVTYRIFVDMAPGYKFQSAWGSTDHPLIFTTSTAFFNNEDRGDKTPSYTKNQAKNNTVMLDSWVSVGAGCVGNFGILKSEDNGINNVVNADGILHNTDTLAGIPLTTQDGLIAGTPQSVITVGLDADLEVLNANSQSGSVFSTTNGAWASLYGSKGPTATNRVLIAQITTKGVFTFQFSIQIKDTVTNAVEQYVPANPSGIEQYFPGLNYSSNIPPTVSITSPLNGSSILSGNPVNIQTAVSDLDGVVKKVVFYIDGNIIGSDTASPFSYNFMAVYGDHIIAALAIDDYNDSTMSVPVSIHVGTAGITENITKSSVFNLYPNPASTKVMLEIIPDNKINHASYQILDLNGKMIRANNLGAINNSYNGMIDLSALSSGQYIIQLNLDDQRLRQLIIKK